MERENDERQAERQAARSPNFLGAALEYMVDAGQRSVLFMDVMRQRGSQYREHLAETVPHVLDYAAELVIDGRTLPQRPVNYLLVRIVPPKGVDIDMKRRPFVVVDPRAGHGPGIGGFKADSEIGVAMKAGHPCYFVGFTPDPMPGQTIEDIARAEAVFLEKVISLHPEADGKPCVIGNCQAGWAVAILASIRPELFGPIILAGAPLSYWAGVRGQNPMRYSGGLLGGSWLTALSSDMGAGKFDGGKLVANFENQNPANTLWTKQYNVYSKVDTEAKRYLEFEKWWGGHVNLNAEEIQFIVDELFVGNKLAAGLIETSDGTAVDLRNIRSPIVVFCSKGDNITPPQQALDSILDLYDDVDEMRSFGQTIVYTVHKSIGHLGIFVSGGNREEGRREFSSNIDLIDLLPPGLYEATFERKSGDTASPDLTTGEWIMRCEKRTLDDIRAMGGNSAEDERRFATAARVSEINLSLYRAFMQPMVKAIFTPQVAEPMKRFDTGRLQYEAFTDAGKSVDARTGEGRRAGPREPQAGGVGQSVPRRPANVLGPDRQVTRKLSGDDGESLGSDVPRDLRISGAAGRRRRRSRVRPATEAGKIPDAPGTVGKAHCGAEIEDHPGRPDRVLHSGPALCRRAAGSGRRARLRGTAPDSYDRGRIAAFVGAVQGDGTRTVLHAAAGYRSHARCNSEIAAGGRCRTQEGPCRHSQCPERRQRNIRRNRGTVENGCVAIRSHEVEPSGMGAESVPFVTGGGSGKLKKPLRQ